VLIVSLLFGHKAKLLHHAQIVVAVPLLDERHEVFRLDLCPQRAELREVRARVAQCAALPVAATRPGLHGARPRPPNLGTHERREALEVRLETPREVDRLRLVGRGFGPRRLWVEDL
jgi:hypothetical protein